MKEEDEEGMKKLLVEQLLGCCSRAGSASF